MSEIMTWRQVMQHGLEQLKTAGIVDAESDIHIFAMHVLQCNYSSLILHMEDAVEEEARRLFESYVMQRLTHKPCQYITGIQNFMGFDFETDAQVLIPRPETELLVEQACRIANQWSREANGLQKRRRILDLCCGSGCIGISVSKLLTCEKEVVLADISDAAIALSNRNKERLGADGTIIKTDLFEQLSGRFDMILSNPPYIRTAEIATLMEEVRDFEPHLALDGKADGLYFYKKIVKEARDYLYEDGYLLFEIGQDQLEAVRGLLVENGYTDIIAIKDYAGWNRIVGGKLRSNLEE